jgi:uncharacterized membrane protein YfcA
VDFLIVFIIGLLASTFGSVLSGGVSLISLSLLSFYGFPALIALGIFRVGTFGFQIGGFYSYNKAKKIVWKHILPFVLIGVPSAYIGAQIVVSVPEDFLEKLIGWVLILFIPIAIFKPSLGTVSTQVSKAREKVGYVVYAFTSIWGSSFVVGAGIMQAFTQAYFFGMTILEVKGTTKIPSLVKGIITISVFAYAGAVEWIIGFVFMGGMFIGSIIGAHVALKIGDIYLRNILLVTVGVLSLKLILGY